MENHHDPVLDVPLERLAALGLARPPGRTVRRHLEAAVEAGLLPAPPVERYLAVVDRAGHSPDGVDAADVHTVAAALTAAVDAVEPDDPRLEEVRRRLAPAPPPPIRHRRRAEDRINRLEFEPDPPPPEPDAEPPPEDPRPVRRHRLWIVAAVAWTLAAAVLGHLAGDPLADLARSATSRVLGWRVGDPERFERLRREAGERPDDVAVWRALTAEARRLERWDHVVLALERRVSLEPDNAALLNELAWLRLTTDESWLRDPVRALELAERAYALDPAPNIADTLAEAAYQTGDPERAVALEEGALEQVRGNDQFYRRQLQKFRDAAQHRPP